MQEELLQVARPESEGVPSGAIIKLIGRLEKLRLPMHSLLVLRRGRLLSENYWKPFHRGRKHRMYSVSKSWVSLAIGVMADEGRISLDDAIAGFFPEYLPDNPHEYITRATIRDMLRMTDCHDSTTYGFSDGNWIKTWFDTPPTHPAGTIFSYNTACTNICCAIVEKLAGTSFIEYLYPRVLTPIGASEGITCIRSPEGYSFGGSGVLCTPLDLARVAQLCMNGGVWGGKRLIGERYIREATSRQVDNTLTNEDIVTQQGYGYQFWRTRDNGYAFYGMGSQLAFCLPDLELIVVTTGDTQGCKSDMHAIQEAIWQELLPAIKGSSIGGANDAGCYANNGGDGGGHCSNSGDGGDGGISGDSGGGRSSGNSDNCRALPEDPAAFEALARLSETLALPVVPGALSSPTAALVSGVTYRFAENPLNIKAAKFDFSADSAVMTYEKHNGVHRLAFGLGKLIEQPFPETHYSGARIGTPASRGYETQAGAAWADENTLIAKASVTDDYFGSFNMNATFIGDELTLLMTKYAEDFLHDYQGFAAGNRRI